VCFAEEWRLLRNLPKLSVLDGSPLNRADLRAVKIDMCRLCVILSAQTPNRLEPVLADKEVLLTALNIKSMNFSEEEIPANGGASEVSDDGDSRPNGAPTSAASQPPNNDNIVQQLLGRSSSGGKLRGKKGSTPIIVDLALPPMSAF